MTRPTTGPAAKVLERLQNIRDHGAGDGWEARCPAHEDKHNSLGVSIGEGGKVLLFCQAGCRVEDVVAAIGLKMPDLWPEEEERQDGRREIAATYDYLDESGIARFQAVRYRPKGFSQRRPLSGGQWVWGLSAGVFRHRGGGHWTALKKTETPAESDKRLDGVTLFIYRLPELLAAPLEEPVFIVEGEKDVESLRAIGLVATTSPMGAGKWRKSYAGPLRGRRCILIPDNDESGMNHMRQVAESLDGLADSVRTLLLPNLPPKADVSDWLAQGNTKEQLLALAAAPPPQGKGDFPQPIHVLDLVRADPVKSWLWKGFLARGEVTLFSALWKAGKTTLLAHLLKALERGEDFCGYSTQAARVLFITEENETRWAQRRDEIGLAGRLDFLIRPFASRPRQDRWEEFVGHVATLVKQRAYDLVVGDTLANLWPVKDENDAASVQAALMPIHQLVSDQASTMLVHHQRKSDGTEATSSRGSGALPAFVDTIVEFRRFNASDRRDHKRVLTGYGRHDETPSEVVIELGPQGYSCCGGDREEMALQDISRTILGILPANPPGLTIEQITDLWPGEQTPARDRILNSLRRGVDGALWQREGAGKKGSPYTFWMTEKAEKF